jgi:hypothetical protein
LATKHMHSIPHGIFTVPIFGNKFYVVNSPHVTNLVQARSKYNTLGWVAVVVMGGMGGMPKRAMDLLFKGVERGDVGSAVGFVHGYHKVELRELSLGNSLNRMRRDFANEFEPFIETLRTNVQKGQGKVDIWEWLRKAITVSVGRGIWGPLNPYGTDPGLWEQFWIFSRSYHLLKYRFPRIFAPGGAVAREKIVDAFVEFGEKGGFETASSLAQGRVKIIQETGLNKREVARMAVSQSVGQFDNTATLSFALLSWILQDPELMQRIRTELEPVTKINEQGRKIIDIYRVGDECPLLLSAFHEVLRCIAVGVTVRHVEQDYTFEIKSQNAQYLFRKGALIWGSGVSIHTCSDFYEQPEKFIPDRFLDMKCPETQISGLYRAFGGGGHICLGRHYARTIVPGAVGSLLMEFDFAPYKGQQLCVPKRSDLTLGHATPNSFGNVFASLKIRQEQCVKKKNQG